ncbi:MAG: DMT family transporter [Streptosporangiaceae bacterium]
MISYVLAFLGAMANATGNALNRKASEDEPEKVAFRWQLFEDLIHKRVWLSAVGLMTVSFIFASAALGFGQLASVQLIIVLELPMTLIGGSLILGSKLAVRDWVAVAVMTGGVICLLALLHPRPGPPKAIPPFEWIMASVANLGAIVVLFLAAKAHPSSTARAGLLGLASGFAYGLTAAFTKGMADQFNSGGVSGVLTSWQLYATVTAGITAAFLLQNAYQAGPLTASQPGITLVDPIVSTLWGVVVFGEQINHGVPLALAPLALLAVAGGVLALSHSPVLHLTQTGEDRTKAGREAANLARADS